MPCVIAPITIVTGRMHKPVRRVGKLVRMKIAGYGQWVFCHVDVYAMCTRSVRKADKGFDRTNGLSAKDGYIDFIEGKPAHPTDIRPRTYGANAPGI